MKGKKILIVDDDHNIRQVLAEILTNSGATVDTAENGEEGLRQLYTKQPDLVIIDIVMPRMDGWELINRIRQLSNLPIMMLSASSSDQNIIRGLKMGACSFVSKPFVSDVLLAKVEAVLRKATVEDAEIKTAVYSDDHLAISLDTQRVEVAGQPIKLSKTEYKLLAYLVANANRLVAYDQIVENVWGWRNTDNVSNVHVYISRLRQKLEADPQNPQYLLLEYGIGYRFKQ